MPGPPQLEPRRPQPVPGVGVEVRKIGRRRLVLERDPQAVGEPVRIDERAEAVAQPRVDRRLALLEEEVHLHRPVAEPDERVRRLPRDLVEPAQPAPEALGDRNTVRPQLLETARPRDDEEVDVGALVCIASRQRSLEQQRPDALVGFGPADAGLHDRVLPVRAHRSCPGSMPPRGVPSRLHARARAPGGAAGGDARASRDARGRRDADHRPGRRGARRRDRNGARPAVGDVVARGRGDRARGVGGRAGRPAARDQLGGDAVARRRAGAGPGERRRAPPARRDAHAAGGRRARRCARGSRSPAAGCSAGRSSTRRCSGRPRSRPRSASSAASSRASTPRRGRSPPTSACSPR